MKKIIYLFIFFISSKFAHSSELLDLQEQLKSAQGVEQIKLHLEIATKLKATSYKDALKHANSALKLIESFPDPKSELVLLNLAAEMQVRQGQYDLTEKSANQAKKLAKDIGQPLAEAKALHILTIRSVYLGDLETAGRLNLEALAIRKREKASLEVSKSLIMMGVIEKNRGNFNLAIEYYHEAMPIVEASNNKPQMAAVYTNIASINTIIGDHESALVYLKRVLEISLQGNNTFATSQIHYNIGASYRNLEQCTTAMEHYRQGLELIKDKAAPQQKAYLHHGMASCQLEMEAFQDAYDNFIRAENYFNEFPSHQLKSDVYRGLTLALIKLGQYEKALSFALQDLELNNASEKDRDWDVYYNLYTIYYALGDYKKAAENLNEFTNLRLAAINSKNAAYVADLQEKYEAEKKQKTIDALSSQNAIQTLTLEQQRFVTQVIIAASLGFIVLVIFILKTWYLEKRVKERTQEIAINHETISNLLAKKNQLFSNVSHEFRTPLTLILGPVGRLLKEVKDKQIRASLTTVIYNANRLLRMVEQLLELGRLDLLPKDKWQCIDVGQTFSKVIANMTALFEENELQVEQHIEKDLWVKGSYEGLENIAINLVSNAIKYTPSQGNIILSARQENKLVIISVQDTGIGIEEKFQEKVFERFFRVEDPAGQAVAGTGIGLSMVKELTEKYGGSIELDSQVGEGTCIRVILPLVEEQVLISTARESESQSALHLCENESAMLLSAQDIPIVDQASKTSQTIDSQSSEDRPTVLIVEDNPQMREYIAQSLSSRYRCLSANDGREGIRIALEQIPDLIVSDLMMPKSTGFDLAEVIRDDQKTAHIPIVMLTAKGEDSTRQEAWQHNIDEFLTKPFNEDELLLRCENLLAIRSLIGRQISQRIESTDPTKRNFAPLMGAQDQAFIEKLEQLLEANFTDSNLNAKSLSEQLYLTEKQLQRKLKSLLGQTIPEYVRNFRLRKGADLLKEEADKIANIAIDVGFSSQSYFSKCFQVRYGMSPKEYQKSAGSNLH